MIDAVINEIDINHDAIYGDNAQLGQVCDLYATLRKLTPSMPPEVAATLAGAALVAEALDDHRSSTHNGLDRIADTI